MSVIEIDLASTLSRMVRFTDDADHERAVKVDCRTVGADPAVSATLAVAAQDAVPGPLTCHVLFPEIRFSAVPQAVELIAAVDAGPVNFIIDAADETGPCVEVPVGRKLMPGHGALQVELEGKPFMVWKEKRQRAMVPPVRFKYLLIISREGQPFTVTLSRLRFHLAQK